MDTQDLSIAEMGRLLRAGNVTSETLARDALARVASRDSALHAFVLVTEDRALQDARRADTELKSGKDRGPFHGVPYALKDIYDTAGIRTTCHSKLRLNVVPKEDSVAAARLREAGGVLLGKLATHEFAIGGPSFDLPFPPARNPWNPDHVTGGSSSGSGTAIGARMVRMAMGSDTGGSIRGPAAWCGTVGIKATYGRVSRRGVFPLSWTLDHIGPLARSVEDAAITLQVLAGHDPQDPASADVPVADYRADLEKGVSGLRIGIPRAFFATAKATTREVVAAFDRTAAQLRDAGAVVEDIELPDYTLFAAVGRIIMMAEAFAIHEADMQTRLLDYGETHRRPLHPRRRDHRGGSDPCSTGASRTDRCGERGTHPVRCAADIVGTRYRATLRSTDGCDVVGLADPDNSVQCHRSSGDERTHRPRRQRPAGRRADHRPRL